MSDTNKTIENDSPLYENFDSEPDWSFPSKKPKPTAPKPTPPRPTTPAPESCSCCFADERPVDYSKCEVSKTENFNNVTLDCTGRLLDVNVRLTNVCPNKFVNVAVLVYECGKLLSLKVCRLFTGNGSACIPSLNTGKFCFVFDDEPCPPARTFTIKIVANYLES